MHRVFSACFVLLLCLHSAFAAGPTYMARKDIPSGFATLSSVAVGDFNGDGVLDLAVTGTSDKRLAIFLNDGKGNFSSPVITTATTAALGLGPLVLGDVNGDGKLDVIVGPVGGDQIDLLFFGKGDGTFTQGPNITGTYGIVSALLVDVNKDGRLDLISGGNGAVDVYLGDGKSGFKEQFINTGTPIYGPEVFLNIVAADFNRDDKLDFITSIYGPNKLQFYAGVGDGTFKVPVDFVPKGFSPPDSLAVADFNRDGILDLLVSTPNIVSLLRGNGDGSLKTSTADFQTITIPDSTRFKNGDYAPFVAAADVNGDSLPDIITADPYNSILSVLLNDGKGSFLQTTPDFTAQLAGTPKAVTTADLNGDGLPDLIATDTKTQSVSYFLSIKPKVAPTVAVSSSAAQVLAGSSVTVSVSVTGGATKPTGNVTLTDGGQPLGQAQLDSNGTASFNLPSLAAGAHSFVASYTGDTNYLTASNSAAVAVAVSDVTVTLPASSQTIAAGGNATYSVALTPVANFSGSVAFTCSGLPVGYSCSSTSVAISGQATTGSVRVVSGTAANTVPALPFHRDGFAVSFAVLLLGCVLPVRRQVLGSLLCLVLLGLLGTVLSGCSGGGSSSVASTTPVYRGTTNFTITSTLTQGAQTTTHTSQATLTVQ